MANPVSSLLGKEEMITTEIATTIAQAAVLIVGVIIAGIFGLQKLLKGWSDATTESNVTRTMHEELKRMAEQNEKLSEQLGKFQAQVISLSNQLTELSIENNRLHMEVVRLTEEVARLQGIISHLR